MISSCLSAPNRPSCPDSTVLGKRDHRGFVALESSDGKRLDCQQETLYLAVSNAGELHALLFPSSLSADILRSKSKKKNRFQLLNQDINSKILFSLQG